MSASLFAEDEANSALKTIVTRTFVNFLASPELSRAALITVPAGIDGPHLLPFKNFDAIIIAITLAETYALAIAH